MSFRFRHVWVPVALALAIYTSVSYFLAYSVTQAERKVIDDRPEDHGLAYEEVLFSSRTPDVLLSGWYIGGDDGRPVVVFVHGIHAHRASDHALDLSVRLVEAGFATLLFDLRGHGRSSGEQVSGGQFEQQDLLGAIDFLVGLGVERRRIAVLGNSMGGAVALMTAARDSTIAAVVADSPYADVADLVPQETGRATGVPEWMVPPFVPGMRHAARLCFAIDMDTMVPETAVTRIAIPVLLIHGLGDTRVDPEHSRRIHQRAADGSDLWLVPGVEHVEAFQHFPDAYVERVVVYLESRLGGAEHSPDRGAG